MQFSNYELVMIRERISKTLHLELLLASMGLPNNYTNKEIETMKHIQTKIHNYLETLNEKEIMIGE